MGRSEWNPFGFQFHAVASSLCFVFFLFQQCWSLNLEGLALLDFRGNVDSDPYGTFTNWDANDCNPCVWFGVHCMDGKVQVLDLKGLSLEGTLSPKLGKLHYLISIVLYDNQFTGSIPKEIGDLTMLELLDLRANNLSGKIPAEIGQMLSLKRLLLCDNNFQGSIPSELGKLTMLLEIQFDPNLTFSASTGIICLHRKFGHCIWQTNLKQLKKADSFIIPIKGKLQPYLDLLPLFFRKGIGCGERVCENLPNTAEPRIVPNAQRLVNLNFVRRRLNQESQNLPATAPVGVLPPDPKTIIPSTRSSGSFPAIPKPKVVPPPSIPPTAPPSIPPAAPPTPPAALEGSDSSQTSGSNGKHTEEEPAVVGSSKTMWKYLLVVPCLAFILIIAAFFFCACRKKGSPTIGPWKSGLSGQLQKAFVTGVPKLNRSELETACEDFSNIIDTLDDCTMYKGTLSSGVEIAVASSSIKSYEDWSKNSESAFRKKIDTLSRVNHKNFVNLLGYCEEDEPFLRIMVFEYAPSGTLFEHLHIKEVEHLDWNARMRIIMGTAYCLQYMHHELNPPVAHPNLKSNAIYLTDDYAAKISDISFWGDFAAKSKISGDDEAEHSGRSMIIDTKSNIYSFGLLLVEIISGKVPHNEKLRSTLELINDYMNDNQNTSYLIDASLKSVKNNELDLVCEVILECLQEDPGQRPTMKDIIAKLREVISISPDAATPRLSPLWWAELEILSVEAT